MPEINRSLIEIGGTLSIKLHGRKMDFYPLTKLEINSLGANTIFREVCLTLAAILGGVVLNILLVMTNKNLPEEMIVRLVTLKWACLGGFGLFFILFIALCIFRLIVSWKITRPQIIEVESGIRS